jgi:prepilin-type processing-associated H-X9-DG protein
MLSENLIVPAWTWTRDLYDQATGREKYHYGFCWHDVPRNLTDAVPRQQKINSKLEIDDLKPPLFETELEAYIYARPSSYHPGGVNAMFCDGHLAFLTDGIAYHVYRQLMTSNSERADDPTAAIIVGDDAY